MKRLMDNMKKSMKRIWESYLKCMEAYGEALMKGGSYGCA